MLSEFRQHKLNARFRRLDVDGNGTIDQSDLEALGRQLCDQLTSSAQNDERGEIMAGYAAMWQQLVTHADGDGDGRISEDEYMSAMESGVLGDEASYQASVGRIVRALFRAVDTDGSGNIDLDELTQMGAAADMGSADMQGLFGAIDADGDGQISSDEFEAAMRDFYYSDDPTSIGRFLFANVS